MALTLHDRLCLIVGRRSSRDVSELTGWNEASVRRYLKGNAPPAAFVAELCRVTGTSPQWLVSGTGAMSMDEVRASAMNNVELAELVVSLCSRIEELRQRIEHVETERMLSQGTVSDGVARKA